MKLLQHKSTWFIGLIGFLLGALLILGIRFVTYHPDKPHFHANFAVYINGQREQFNSPFYYEEVAACDVDGNMTPKQRTHMHDMKPDVVHVHDYAVTWGHFFQNIGWNVGEGLLQTNDKIYTTDGQNKVTFILNGQKVRDIATEKIGDKDRLLINFGDQDQATLQKESASVPTSAEQYDRNKDPASCSGSGAPTMKERWEHLF